MINLRNIRKNIKWPKGRCWIQFSTVFSSLNLTSFFLFFFASKDPFIHRLNFSIKITSIHTGLKYNGIHLINPKWRIQGGWWFQFFFNNKWLHRDTTAIVKDYLPIIPRVRVGDQVVVAKEARSAQLAIIISYPTSANKNNCFITNVHKISRILLDFNCKSNRLLACF